MARSHGLKTKTLRRMLKKKGMKTTGKKATLMKRLHMRGGEYGGNFAKFADGKYYDTDKDGNKKADAMPSDTPLSGTEVTANEGSSDMTPDSAAAAAAGAAAAGEGAAAAAEGAAEAGRRRRRRSRRREGGGKRSRSRRILNLKPYTRLTY